MGEDGQMRVIVGQQKRRIDSLNGPGTVEEVRKI